MNRCAILVAVALSLAAPGASPRAGTFELLSRTLIQGPAQTVSFSGETVLLGTGNGVAIFKDGSLENPSFLPLEGDPYEIVVNGSYAYVAAASGGLVVIRLGPGPPEITYRYSKINASTCAVSEGSLFAAGPDDKLSIFNLIDAGPFRGTPATPHPVLGQVLRYPLRSLSTEGDLLAITYQQRAEIYRVDSLRAPRMLSEVSFENDARKGILRGGVLFVLTNAGEVLCWNVGAKGAPSRLSPLQTKGVVDIAADDRGGMILTQLGFLIPFRIERAASAGGGAAVKLKTGKGFTLESVNRYGQPIATGSITAPQTQKATGVFISGNRIGVIAPFDGLRLLTLAKNGAKPLGFFATRGFSANVIADKGLLYAANGYDGVRIGSVARDGTVSWIGHLQTLEARDVALSGHTLVVADGDGGIKVADVSDPRKPAIVGQYASPWFLSKLALSKGRAYCAGGMGGIEIVDISKPGLPKLFWKRDLSEVRGVSVDERYLYVPDGNEGLRIFSLAGREPALVGVLDTPGWNCDCFVAGDKAFLADGGRGVVIADVADRKKPRTISSLFLNTVTREVFPSGTTLFAAAHTKGIAAIDISDLRKPTVAAWYDTADDGRGVFADNDFVYAASGSGGVYVFRYHR